MDAIEFEGGLEEELPHEHFDWCENDELYEDDSAEYEEELDPTLSAEEYGIVYACMCQLGENGFVICADFNRDSVKLPQESALRSLAERVLESLPGIVIGGHIFC